jgi:hypothetical protein
MRLLFLFILGALFASTALALSEAACEGEGTPSPTKLTRESVKAVGIDEFMINLDRYPGLVLVKGVVSAVSLEHKLVGLIDAGEYESCGVVTCAQLTLPVLWNGQMPTVEEVVLVEGQVQKQDGKLFFMAQALERIGTQQECQE